MKTMSNDNQKGGKTPKPAPAEEIEILHATNISLLATPLSVVQGKTEKPD